MLIFGIFVPTGTCSISDIWIGQEYFVFGHFLWVLIYPDEDASPEQEPSETIYVRHILQ